MAFIQIDGLTIDLTNSLNFYAMESDGANVDVLGDNTQKLEVVVGHDSLTLRANFMTMVDMMHAIADANGYKVVPVVPKGHEKDAINHSEYFDHNDKYHVNKSKSAAKPQSRKAYIKKTGMLDFNKQKDVKK